MKESSGQEEKRRVRFDDWMGDSDDDDHNQNSKQKKNHNDFEKLFAEDKFSKREKKGHLLLQLQKTYKGDERF